MPREIFPKSHSSILIYHRIAPGPPAKDPWRTTVSLQKFERQMRFLHEHGYCCIDLKEILKSPRNRQVSKRKGIALTFDDGYESFYTLANPILKRYGFKATVFLVTDRIGEKGDYEADAADPFLNWEQIRRLYADGIVFGSHTCTHPRLSHLSSTQVREELISSKKCLEGRLGSEISFLAYPFGDSNPEVQQLAETAGYEAAFGCRRGKSGRFNIWRWTCRTNDTLLAFRLKLTRYSHYANSFREETSIGQFLRKLKHALNR